MKRSVWRYDLHPLTTQRIQMPTGAQVIHVAEHPVGDVSLWALVDENAGREVREFTVAGTGWEIVVDNPHHVGSIVRRDGLVLHVFETAHESPERGQADG